MKLIYDPNLIYIVVSSTNYPQYVGKETRVTTKTYLYNGSNLGQETDLVCPKRGENIYFLAGCLRPKNPPSGEQKINEILAGKLHVNDNVKEIDNV